LDTENNFVGTLKIMSKAAKSFANLATSLSVLHNYFDNKITFLIRIETKILDFSAKSFFSCCINISFFIFIFCLN